MPLIPFENVGSIGIVKDTPPYNLPQGAWSDGNNVRFLDNGVKKMAGYKEVMATCPFAPYYINPYLATNGTYYWIAYGSNNIAVYDGATWTDITRTSGSYGANTTSRRWTSTNLNGLLIATNGFDSPQMWPLSAGIPSVGTPFTVLSNWPDPTYSCKSIRSFRTFLIGLNWTRANEEPRLVKWSTEAAYGQAPSTWNRRIAARRLFSYL
jgi:hypothetical protein